jgi:hypothetical protein
MEGQFYIHGSVHPNSILIRPNKMPQYAGIYLLQNHSLHVSGVHRMYRVTQKKRELLKNPTKIEEIQEKKFIDRN